MDTTKIFALDGQHLILRKSEDIHLIWPPEKTSIAIDILPGVKITLRHLPYHSYCKIRLGAQSFLVERIEGDTSSQMHYTLSAHHDAGSKHTLREMSNVDTGEVNIHSFLSGYSAQSNIGFNKHLQQTQRYSADISQTLTAKKTTALLVARVCTQDRSHFYIKAKTDCSVMDVEASQDLKGLNLHRDSSIEFNPFLTATSCIPATLSHQAMIQPMDLQVLSYLRHRGLNGEQARACYIESFREG